MFITEFVQIEICSKFEFVQFEIYSKIRICTIYIFRTKTKKKEKIKKKQKQENQKNHQGTKLGENRQGTKPNEVSIMFPKTRTKQNVLMGRPASKN
jgi:hypothetical protein